MKSLTPMLNFSGQCAQAIELYEKAFGGRVVVKVLYSDANPKDFICKEDEKDYIFHCQMKIGDQLIYMADDSNKVLSNEPGGPAGNSSMMNICMGFDTDDDVKAAYKIMADGAKVIVPMHSTTYSTCYVFLIDKFGIGWELMTDK